MKRFLPLVLFVCLLPSCVNQAVNENAVALKKQLGTLQKQSRPAPIDSDDIAKGWTQATADTEWQNGWKRANESADAILKASGGAQK